ncbi:MAG: C4-type zinc ribbon domain-containing protein [Pontiellaceae bacterium]|nr:C4-type zinc ribbon domain-containing protein [Pontiellaceae bacterium]
MAHPLEALLVLQEKDRKIIKLKREIRDIPARKADIEKQLEGAKKRLEAARETLKKLTADLKQLEVEAGTHREKIVKYKQQQMEARTNDQYRAFLHEIAAAEKVISGLEDRELVLMEQLESSKKLISEREAELKEEEDGIGEEKEMLEERLKEVQEDLEAMTAERERITSAVNHSLLVKYTRLFLNKGDFAIVQVENDHCSGCHMRLPPQIINDALNPDKLVICNFCGRMLLNRR